MLVKFEERVRTISSHQLEAVVGDDLQVDESGVKTAKVISTSDYYPFGMEMPDRSYTISNYRYGFNGKEKDQDGEWGSSTHYDYGFRVYNPSIGRFLSVDPLTASYPWYTPYQFAGNTPISAYDLDGLEPEFPIGTVYYSKGQRVSAEFIYAQRMVIYKQVMHDNYIHKEGSSHVFDRGRALSTARSVLENGNKDLAIKQFKEFNEKSNAALADYDTRLFNGQLKTIRELKAKEFSEMRKERKIAEINFAKSQEVTAGDIASLSINGTGFVVSGMTAEFGVGLIGLAITGDNFQKDIRIIMDKLNNRYKPGETRTIGSMVEKEVLGTDFVYDLVGVGVNAQGGYNATLKILNKSGKIIDKMDLAIQAISGSKSAVDAVK